MAEDEKTPQEQVGVGGGALLIASGVATAATTATAATAAMSAAAVATVMTVAANRSGSGFISTSKVEGSVGDAALVVAAATAATTAAAKAFPSSSSAFASLF